MTESNTDPKGGAKKRISQLTGFMPSKIILAGSTGKDTATFIVNGVGFETDFSTYRRNPSIDTSDRFQD